MSSSSNNQIQTMLLHDALNATPSFTFFSLLPTELRLKIWKASFTARGIFLSSASHRPLSGLLRYMLINHESRQIFLESYTRCFHQKGQKAIYINFKIDTLCFKYMRSLQKMIKHYDLDMRRVQRIELEVMSSADNSPTGFRSHSLTFQAMTSLQMITIRWNTGSGFGFQNNGRWYPNIIERKLQASFDAVRNALLRQWDPETPYSGPRASVIFPSGDTWGEVMFLETTVDPNHCRYGVIAWENESSTCVDFTVRWTGEDQPWISADNVLATVGMRRSRTPRSRSEIRAFWDNSLISASPDKLVKHLVDSEFNSVLSYLEIQLLMDIHTLWWDNQTPETPLKEELPWEILQWTATSHPIPMHWNHNNVWRHLVLAARAMPWPNSKEGVKALEEALLILQARYE